MRSQLQEAGWTHVTLAPIPRLDWLGIHSTWQATLGQLPVLVLLVAGFARNLAGKTLKGGRIMLDHRRRAGRGAAPCRRVSPATPARGPNASGRPGPFSSWVAPMGAL